MVENRSNAIAYFPLNIQSIIINDKYNHNIEYTIQILFSHSLFTKSRKSI